METSVLIQVPYELESAYSPLEERTDIDYTVMSVDNFNVGDFLIGLYSELKGKKIVYQDHPTPKERQDNIFSMFKDDIPEEMNTEEGNKVLNLILNSSEYAEDWLRYKISKGKL